VMCMRMASLNL